MTHARRGAGPGRPRRSLRKALPLLFLAFLISWVGGGPTLAAARITARSGNWKQSATWVGGVVPGPADEVTIATGHRVEFGGPENPGGECARLVIQPGGEFFFTNKVTTFLVGGDGAGVRGGIDIAGSLSVPAGVTVAIDPDGNARSEEDGVTVRAGGRLVLQGSVLYQGTVSSVLSDDEAGGISFIDPGLRPGPDTPSQRVVWRSGQRKGRWYEITSASSGEMTLDYRCRSNAERTGEPEYTVGTASILGFKVTGIGTNWTDELASGSWWWCQADGPSHKIRVHAVRSPTSLELVGSYPYGRSACATAGPYVLRDENQPNPAVDVSERIAPGDTYSLILPAVLRSLHGSDDTYDEQIFVRVEPGGAYRFENASFESVGKEAWGDGEGSGIRIAGFRGNAPPDGTFNTVEIYRYGGEAGIEWEDSSNFDADWLFVHWAHPLITTPNEGHGVKIEHTTPGSSADNVRIRNARFDRTNDDFVWWASRAGGTSGVYDSIGKYCPNTASGHSCDGVDTNDLIGSTGGQIRIERNLFANIGAGHGGSCMQASVGSATPQPAWRGEGWLARDNVCLNLQSVPCMDTIGGGLTWDRERIWAVNNVCVGVWGNGIKGIPRVFQNEILDFGTGRRSGVNGLRGAYEARGNVLWGVGKRLPGNTQVQRGVGIGFSLAGEANWAGTTWTLTDNVILVSGIGIRAASWSSAEYPASGDAIISHNLLGGNPLDFQVLTVYGIVDLHAEPSDARLIVTDNIFDHLVSRGSQAGVGYLQASEDLIDRNVVHTWNSPFWGGVLAPQNDSAATTDINYYSRILEIRPGSGAWSAVTTDGDRPGPRFAGTLAGRLPISVPGLVPVVDPEDDDGDRDGDALIDRWDNCPDTPNPGWADSDGDGVGDACEP